MKRRVEKENEADLMARYPIKGKTSGWYFRITEVSNGAWQVDGSDQWGRHVSRTGTDPDVVLAACDRDAAEVNRDELST